MGKVPLMYGSLILTENLMNKKPKKFFLNVIKRKTLFIKKIKLQTDTLMVKIACLL